MDDWGSIPDMDRDFFSLRHGIHTGPGVHPASYPLGTKGCSPGIRRTECEADHSPPSSAEVKNAWTYVTIPHKSSWRGA
jgi:hypothetical protein